MTQKTNSIIARARLLSVPISTKQSVEISRALRFKSLKYAKKYMHDVAEMKRPVSFVRFTRDVGHKAGIAAGRYPQKAAKAFLALLENVEANATHLGLDASSLKITKILANKASIPMTPGRRRYATKRTHLEVEVQEGSAKKAKKTVAKKDTVEGGAQ